MQLFGHFQFDLKVYFFYLMDQNMAGSKKVHKIKNCIFDARQPREEIFDLLQLLRELHRCLEVLIRGKNARKFCQTLTEFLKKPYLSW